MEIISFQLMCTEMIVDRSLKFRSAARKTAPEMVLVAIRSLPSELNVHGH
jgi:hypothetical protein